MLLTALVATLVACNYGLVEPEPEPELEDPTAEPEPTAAATSPFSPPLTRSLLAAFCEHGAAAVIVQHNQTEGRLSACQVVAIDADGLAIGNAGNASCDDEVHGCSWSVAGADELPTTYYDDDCDGDPEHWEGNQLPEDEPAASAPMLAPAPTHDCWVNELDETSSHAYLDRDCDGRHRSDCVDERFDAQGRVVLSQYDARCDGHPTSCTVASFDAGGHESSFADDDCNGTPDHDCYAQRVDDNGYVTPFLDDDCDGDPDRNCHDASTQRDADGTLTIDHQYDPECDGADVSCAREVVTREGALVSLYTDLDCDGVDDPFSVRGAVLRCAP